MSRIASSGQMTLATVEAAVESDHMIRIHPSSSTRQCCRARGLRFCDAVSRVAPLRGRTPNAEPAVSTAANPRAPWMCGSHHAGISSAQLARVGLAHGRRLPKRRRCHRDRRFPIAGSRSDPAVRAATCGDWLAGAGERRLIGNGDGELRWLCLPDRRVARTKRRALRRHATRHRVLELLVRRARRIVEGQPGRGAGSPSESGRR